MLEIGYLFNRKFWHQGYATEAAAACKQYAFEVLNAEEVCSIICDMNLRCKANRHDSHGFLDEALPRHRHAARPFRCHALTRRSLAGQGAAFLRAAPVYAGLFMRLGFAFLSQFLYHVRVTLWEG